MSDLVRNPEDRFSHKWLKFVLHLAKSDQPEPLRQFDQSLPADEEPSFNGLNVNVNGEHDQTWGSHVSLC